MEIGQLKSGRIFERRGLPGGAGTTARLAIQPMRRCLLMSVAALGLMAGTALAQNAPTYPAPAAGATNGGICPGHVPGVGQSEPSSTNASNIDRADSRSTIAPTLPTPPGGDNAGIQNYLRDAERALSRNQTGAAQEAI